MHLGIDLGTSNSAIVGNEGGTLRIFKTPELSDVLPSAILIDRRGNTFTGKRAYEQSAYSPENVVKGFKRLMGTSTPISAGGKSLTPEDASCEILKALLSQAKMAMGEFVPEGAIVTIPAAFNQLQSEATMRSAGAAGLTKVALLQEPVAAALASVASASNKSGQFLVYDLGGGTFDVAIVQSVAGSVTVVAHSGINMCGGRDIDRAIVNTIVRPWLLENFDIPEDFQKHKEYQRIIRIAEYKAEAAKVALSSQLVDRIFADESQINAKDRAGAEIYLDVELTRGQLEELVQDQIASTIEHCRSVLQANGYATSDIDRIVLIGGPTKMPIVRTRVSEQLGIPVDLETDPMTAVAQGAALYADGLDWSRTESTAKSSRASVSAGSATTLKIDFPARTADERVRIRVTFAGADLGPYTFRIDSEDGWSSGLVPLDGPTTIASVPLSRKGENRFRGACFDRYGSPVPEGAANFSITRAAATAAGIPATQTIAVKVVEGFLGSERNALYSIIKKGTLLPAKGSERFVAARDMRANDGSQLDFELYQMEEDVTDPQLNLFIGSFRLTSSELSVGEVIRKGDPIFIHWSVDENGLLNCAFQIDAISQFHETGKMYTDRDALQNFEGDEGRATASQALEQAREELLTLERSLGPKVANEASKLDARLIAQRRALELAYDADTLRSIANEALAIRQAISSIKSRPENLASVTRTELDELLSFYGENVGRSVDEKTNSQIHRLGRHAADALASGTSASIEDARVSLRQLRQTIHAELYKNLEFLASMFSHHSDRRREAFVKDMHDQLSREGERLISAKDVSGLRRVIGAMLDNLPRHTEANIEKLSGLMRG